MRFKYICVAFLAISSLSSCFDLDKSPEGVLSTVNPFTSLGEMNGYLDQFYESGVKVQEFNSWGGGGIAGIDMNSDNMASGAVNTRLNGSLTLANANKLAYYTDIRNVNFFLNNLNFKDTNAAAYKQCVGEAYYFRAWFYFNLFKNYGNIAWLDHTLAPDENEMNLPQEGRIAMVDHILSDLDKAIDLLSLQNSAATMRVHKDIARAFKSEVALYEATWEKYHQAKNDAFYDKTVTAAKIKDYLEQCVAACKAIVDRGVWRIYNTGNPLNDYRQMFQTEDLSSNPEVMWFKKYDGSNVGNSVDRYLNQGGGSSGVTASLVDDYLTRAGSPFVGTAVLTAKATFGDELSPTLRDPRLSQTVCMPGQILRPDQGPYVVPPLNGSGYHKNETGYSLLKYVQIDYTGSLDQEGKGSTPAIQYRYADVLLDYAEALAELDGNAHANEIITILQPLRDRVGMPAMDFDREYNTSVDYPFHHLNKYIQAVRRERRVEQACEGRRLDDIFRWAAAEDLIVGQRAHGALFVGSNLEHHAKYGSSLVYDRPTGNNLYLSGQPGDTHRYILPVNPVGYETGWKFNPNRDYLLPLQSRMLSLTKGMWKQNPGWE